MAPHTQTLVARDDGKGHLNNTYIAGIAVVCAIVVGTAIWLSIHWYRARVKARQEAATHAASTRGSVFVDGNVVFTDKHRSTTLSSSGSSAFSRKDAGSAVMPEPLMTKEEILEFHRQNGTLTHAFKLSVDNSSQMSESSTPSTKSASPSPLPSPSSLAVPARAHTPHGRPISIGKVPRPGSSLNPEFKRSSFNPGFQLTSVTAAGPGERPISTISLQPPSPLGSSFGRAAHSHSGSGSSLGSFLLSGGATERTVRQTFSPVLPDELVIRPGERLTVVQTLDDGWCIVGRGDVDTTGAVPKGEFGQKDQDSVEMGAVPAWVFVKPVKGLIGQRPLRTTSLGVTVQVSAPVGAGHEVISWSNF